jgi:hypothetical protein
VAYFKFKMEQRDSSHLSERARSVAADFMTAFGWNRRDLEEAVGLLKRRAGSSRKPPASTQFFYLGSNSVHPAPSASNSEHLFWPLRAKKRNLRRNGRDTLSGNEKSTSNVRESRSRMILSALASRSLPTHPSRSELISWMLSDMER